MSLLDTFVSQIKLNAGGGVTPGALINATLTPDLLQTGLVEGIPGLTRTTVLFKMLRFADSSVPDPGTSIANFLTAAGQILGGQAMPAISVQLPGQALPGARIIRKELTNATTGLNSLDGLNVAEDVPASPLPAQPSLGQDPGTDTTHDVLAGVPGIAGVIESGVLPPTPLRVSLNWSFVVTNVPNGPTGALNASQLSSLSIVPPIMFADMGQDPIFNMHITVTGTVYVPDPNDPNDPGSALASAQLPQLAADLPFPGIPIPRFLCLFTWPLYGTEATSSDSNPDDSSLLLMYPAGSPLTGVAAVTSAMNSVRQAVAPIVSLLSGPLSTTTVAPFVAPAIIVQQLSALTTGLDHVSNRLSVAAHNDYAPVTTLQASAPSTNSQTRGGLSDLNGIWWDKEFLGNDYYHDHAKSFLWIAPPGGQVVIYRDSKFSSDGSRDHGKMTLTTGDTCLAGIPDFRPQPGSLDPNLSPSLSGLANANANQSGDFTNQHPPHDTLNEDSVAWTDSIEFL